VAAWPYRFLLDTGAQTNQFDARLADELGLEKQFRVALNTPTGSVWVAGGRAHQVSLGTATAVDQELLFTNLAGVRAVDAGIQGVLGQQFLAHFDYLLDFRRRRIVFGGVPPAGDRVAIRMVDGRPAIETSEGVLVLDSGVDAVVLRGSVKGRPGFIRTASGSAEIQRGRDLRITVGSRRYGPVAAYLIPGFSLAEDGELPASLFHSVYVSNSEMYAVFEPEHQR
jgi:hypothetical protein